MNKTLCAYSEIMDLWVLPFRWFRKLFHCGLILGAHVLLFKMTAHVGTQDPYTIHKKSVVSQQRKQAENYNFSRLGKTFMSWDSFRLEEIDARRLEALIIKSVPKKLKPRISKYLTQTLELCEHYQLDPFWVLSIMWTESHFNHKAISPVSASGLMQIMPGTAHYLMNVMNRPVSSKIAFQMAKDSNKNIEMGTFFLRKLFIQFDFNFKYATIAYNMGPNGVMRRLKKGYPVGQNHDYLKKARRHYKKLIGPLLAHLNSIPAPYSKTLVAKKPWQSKSEEFFAFDIFKKLNKIAWSTIFSQRLEL